MMPGEELQIVRTNSYSTWDLKTNTIRIGPYVLPLTTKDGYLLRFSPELPYLYLPESIYDRVIQKINKVYKDEYSIDICNKSANKCRFPVSCAVVKKKGLD